MKLNGLEKYFKTTNGEIFDFDVDERTPLIYALRYNKEKDLNLNKKQFDYLIKNSDLKHNDTLGWTPLIYALKYKNEENFNLTNKQWKYVLKNSDLSVITDKLDLNELKKIKSKLLNDEVLSKIDIKKINNKLNKL